MPIVTLPVGVAAGAAPAIAPAIGTSPEPLLPDPPPQAHASTGRATATTIDRFMIAAVPASDGDDDWRTGSLVRGALARPWTSAIVTTASR